MELRKTDWTGIVFWWVLAFVAICLVGLLLYYECCQSQSRSQPPPLPSSEVVRVCGITARIDVCVPNRAMAYEWGRRQVVVTLGKEVGLLHGLELKDECLQIERKVNDLHADLRRLVSHVEAAGLDAYRFWGLLKHLEEFQKEADGGG